jgi:Stress-induced bacterial acidophilic repeat motif
MISRSEPPDTPPAAGYVTLVEYAAQHGATYQRAYSWVRRGRIPAAWWAGRWWVQGEAPKPEGRQGDEARARHLRALLAARSPERRREIGRMGGLASTADPEHRRALARCGALAAEGRRRNYGPCMVCGERPATVKGRCARCNAYLAYRGTERPMTVPRRGPQGPLGPRRRAGMASG